MSNKATQFSRASSGMLEAIKENDKKTLASMPDDMHPDKLLEKARLLMSIVGQKDKANSGASTKTVANKGGVHTRVSSGLQRAKVLFALNSSNPRLKERLARNAECANAAVLNKAKLLFAIGKANPKPLRQSKAPSYDDNDTAAVEYRRGLVDRQMVRAKVQLAIEAKCDETKSVAVVTKSDTQITRAKVKMAIEAKQKENAAEGDGKGKASKVDVVDKQLMRAKVKMAIEARRAAALPSPAAGMETSRARPPPPPRTSRSQSPPPLPRVTTRSSPLPAMPPSTSTPSSPPPPLPLPPTPRSPLSEIE
jgi:hypothetical protein